MDGSKSGEGVQTRQSSTTASAGAECKNAAPNLSALSKFWADINLNPTSKFTINNARTVDDHKITDNLLTSPDQVPKYILNTLMILNYNARKFKCSSLTANDDNLGNMFDFDENEDENDGVNPMDALLAVFYCSNDSLRRDLALKLSACQLSIPLLLPDPQAPAENVTILLPALQSITKSWKDGSDDNTQQVFATEHPFPVVSFIRVGETTMSKSSLINKIMSDGNRHHDIFFHKNIEGGDVQRRIVNGLVELSWYLPGGSEKQTLQNEICFVNLRGDVRDFKKQFRLVFNISSVLCVLLSSECPEDTVKQFLEEATSGQAKVVLIFNEKVQAGAKKYFKDLRNKHPENFSSITRANKNNEDKFLQGIREDIQTSIKKVKAKPLVEIASRVSDYGIQLVQRESHSIFKSVESWLKQGIKEAKNLLKLQMHVPVLAALERKRNLPDKSKIEGNDVSKDIEAEQKTQKGSLGKLDERIRNFLNSIATMDETERYETLNKVKHTLDKMSLQFMKNAYQDYHVASREKEGSGKQSSVEGHLKQLEESIAKYSFGLEHIIRELAQLYQIEESKYDYAGAAADMLLSGQPLEILDGDSSYIPLRWFEAVFTKLENKTKNAKIFVISVVGIQSSGKSTMLNTMFGLEFPVSAGRCTRGVFANLLPVSDSLKFSSKFDYILVIDTEGLSGSADPQLQKRDNELATFTIGVADLTVVNIFGENDHEMKGFLGVAIRTLIRINIFQQKKACKIVHQNVGAADAEDKLTDDRYTLKHDLDKMTKLAAIEENRKEKFQNFNDVMSFDENKDVFYVPSLHQGNPPMAPVNPEYGRTVQRIKESIITLMCSNELWKYSISQFRNRVCNLWKAMLGELELIPEFEKSEKPVSQPESSLPPSPTVVPTKIPVVPNKIPVVPNKIPVVPNKVPVVPTEIPVVPTEMPVAPTRIPVIPVKEQNVKDVSSKTEVEKGEAEKREPPKTISKIPTAAEIPSKQSGSTSPAKKLARIPSVFSLKLSSKLTLKQARVVDDHTLTDNELTTPDQATAFMLKTLMIENYHANEFELEPPTSHKNKTKGDLDDSEDEDEGGVHPMDALLGIFHCSDDSLRRYLALKLSACQLSVPFLLPDPEAKSKKVTILLSVLESVKKSWKGASVDNKNEESVFTTGHPFPVVSFIRVGETTLSKSFLINRIMNDGSRNHEFFFHKNMKGGHVERKIVDGLVELGWYLPGGSRKTIQNEICFANLRGDARNFKKQRDFLLKNSSILCILFPSEEPNEIMKNILEDAIQNKAKVILIFNEMPQTDAREYFKDLTSKHSEKIFPITKAKFKNDDSFFQSMRENIQKNIHEVKAKPLVELASRVSEYDIQLDDDHSPSAFQKNVDSWLKEGIKEAKNLLKLQLHVPVLADLEREIASSINVQKIDKRIEEEKAAQKESLQLLDPRILDCLNSIAKMNEAERNKALNKLSYQLDKMSEDKRIKESEILFGLEHIMRELAQLYQIEESEYDYAGAAADILLSGQPLEILDGDSFYIPLDWFNAVYTKLEQKINNANVFVISVLGSRSSGKSTMLNTMFGLEFPESKRKCARGVSACLLPLSKSFMCVSKFDYILVIDTEGLSGSADPQLRQHDNELATFAIGVADVTIVNMFGENRKETKELLETAVHSFLKMKLSDEKKRSCKIVHQNVTDTIATDKSIVKRFRLKLDLDKMAKLVAIEKKCEDKYETFDDLVIFNEKKDVFYVPNLLEGSPPMAPVNPDYGRAVEKVKENIVAWMSSDEIHRYSVSQFRESVTNQWVSVLKENSISSSRNTIEVRASTSLDEKYFEQSVNVMVMGMNELQVKIETTLKRCSSQDEREKRWKESEKEMRDKAEELRKKIENAMKVFFKTDKDKATLEPWRESMMKRIEKLKELQLLEVTKHCFSVFNSLQKLQDAEDRKLICEKNLLEKAKTFNTSVGGIEDEKKLKTSFEQQWQGWIADVENYKGRKININSEMVSFLCGKDSVVNKEMKEKLTPPNNNIANFTHSEVKIGVHNLTCTVNRREPSLNTAQQKQQSLPYARRIKENAIKKALDFAKQTSMSGMRFTRNDLKQIHQIVVTTIDADTTRFSLQFENSLICDILLYTFARAYKLFYDMEERFWRGRDIRGNLEKNLRPRLEAYSGNVFKKMGKEQLAATSFVDVLKKPIKSEFNRITGRTVAGEVMKNTDFRNKGQFQARILIQLGEEGKFESYIPYLENPIAFLRKKLMDSIENYCTKKIPDVISSLLKKEIKKIHDDVLSAFSIAEDDSKTGMQKLTCWIEQFAGNCSRLVIKKEMFGVALMEDVEKMDVFQDAVREKVANFLETLVAGCRFDPTNFLKWNEPPLDCLFNQTFACQYSCPSCDALCDQTSPNHDVHATLFHRPAGITGYKDDKTRQLNTSFCTKSLAGKRNFRNPNAFWERSPRGKNQNSVNDYYNAWDIPAYSSLKPSKYWQWFMAKFSKELANHFNAIEPDIPISWKRLKFSEAKDQLREEYNL